MAKIVRCREVGVDCDFKARGATDTLERAKDTVRQGTASSVIPLGMSHAMSRL